jgi:hypothetical protein
MTRAKKNLYLPELKIVSDITPKYCNRLPLQFLLIIILVILIITSCKKSNPVQPHQILWMKTYGGNCQEYGCSVQSTSDGGYIVAGYSWSFGAGNPFHTNVYLIKTDAKGDTLWTKIYGDTANDRGYSVQLTSDGGYIIAGFTESFGSGKSDVWLLKTDSNGDTLWTKIYGGEDEDLGYFVQQVSDGVISLQEFR